MLRHMMCLLCCVVVCVGATGRVDAGVQEGQAAVDALGRSRAALLERKAALPAGTTDAALAQLEKRMDQAANQRYGHVSGLYWHTDLSEAIEQAEKMKRPILSLRMLGDLTEEYSCANSRFFRVMLYADPAISSYLRDHYVLHWESVRDVPQVTVTLKDGSTLRRTVTGNSAHLVMTPQGRVVDVIPGLWSPAAFLEQVRFGHGFAMMGQPLKMADGSELRTGPSIRQVHQSQAARTQAMLQRRLQNLGMTQEDIQRATDAVARQDGQGAAATRPAQDAMTVAVTKRVMEAPLLAPIVMRNVQEMWQRMNLQNWAKFAASHEDEVALSDASWALIQAENPGEDVQRFRRTLIASVAADTAFNRYFLKQQVHRIFMSMNEDALPCEDKALTARLYGEVFGMNLNDPWAGLHDPATYTGLTHGGMQGKEATPAMHLTQRQ